MILYTADWLLPIAAPPIRHGAVLVEDGRIAWVGAATSAPTGEQIRTVALGRCALMPGLVNAHSHLELTILRGCLEGLDFREWLRTLTAIRRDVLTVDDLLDSSRLGLVEGLRHGITTYADATDSAAPLTAMRELGVRGIGYVEVFGPDPAQRDESMRALRARVSVLRTEDTLLVRTGVSPHAPYTVSSPLFGAVADYARHEALPVAVHVAESVAEVTFVREGAGPFADRLRTRGIAVGPMAESPIALLEATGLLAARPLLVHAIHVSDADLDRVVSHGASIVHCPISNAKLGQGVAPLDRMLARSIPTGLGSDSVASNNRMHLLEEARQAVLQHALRAGVPDSLTSHEALALATHGGANALGLADQIGTLEAGKAADLAAFPLPESLGPVYDPAVALVHAMAGRAEATLVCVAGRELVRDGIVTTGDAAWQNRGQNIGQRIANALEQWRAGAPA
ncbi:MAG: amidohydrolase family protein [Gemmatimonadaceae bacterium]|nr:amidohydrolase family protein [Gemmatimonadaceae bacterium]